MRRFRRLGRHWLRFADGFRVSSPPKRGHCSFWESKLFLYDRGSGPSGLRVPPNVLTSYDCFLDCFFAFAVWVLVDILILRQVSQLFPSYRFLQKRSHPLLSAPPRHNCKALQGSQSTFDNESVLDHVQKYSPWVSCDSHKSNNLLFKWQVKSGLIT